MKKLLILALLGAFCVMAFGAVVIADEGMKTVDQPAEKFPAKKLNKDGTKKKPPVTFNHGKHGKDLGCVVCHHKSDQAKLDAGEKPKSCFECHGPAAEDKQLDTYKMLHDKKLGQCKVCHDKEKAAGNTKVPAKCKNCHPK